MRKQCFWLIVVTLFLLFAGCTKHGGGGGGTIVDVPDDTSGNGNNSNDSLTMDFVYVDAGYFIRGSDELEDEYPIREIYLDEFYISKTEVTNEQYCVFLNDGNGDYHYGDMRISRSDDYYAPYSGYENHPVASIDYNSALAFARWAGGNLPTEAQWEKASRGTDDRIFPWGDIINTYYADIFRPSDTVTREVGGYPGYASPYGALDMIGSVAEWCRDWYYMYYYYPDISTDTNPTGPDSDPGYGYRVIRGGSFLEDNVVYLRCSFRNYKHYEGRSLDLGFRIVIE